MKYLPLLFLFLTGAAFAESTEGLIQQLTTAVRAELNDPKSQKDASFSRQSQILQSLVTIKVNSVEGKPRAESIDHFFASIEQLRETSTSEKTRELCETLSKQLHREVAEQQTVLVESIKKNMAGAIRSALTAQSSRDFDAPIATASGALSDGDIVNSRDPAHTALVSAVHNTRRFLCDLQDYMVNLGHETSVISENRWKNIIALQNDFSIFAPRSEVLAGLEEFHKRIGIPEGLKPITQEELEKKGREIVATTKSLNDLEQVNAQLAALTRTDETVGLRMQSLTSPQSRLREYARIYAKVQSGNVALSEINSIITHQPELRNDALTGLSNQLVLAALPRLLQVADNAKEGETPVSYLRRLAEQAVAASDWDLLARAIDLMSTVNPDSRQPINDRIAVQAFLAGLNQERARQYALAVASYQKTLGSGAQLISAELVGERLDKIRKEHPEAFEQASSNPAQAVDKNPSSPTSNTRLFPDNNSFHLFSPPTRIPVSPPTVTPPAKQ